MSSDGDVTTEDAIRVVVRLRPPIQRENMFKTNWCAPCGQSIQRTDGKESYTFDHVYDAMSRTEDVYTGCVQEVVKSAMSGYNATIFAYGQTASGKTYTIFGDKYNDGVVQMAVDTIFSTIESGGSRRYLLRMSCVEIYNERVRDLLSDRTDLALLEIKGNVVVSGIVEEVITDRSAVDLLIQAAFERRAVGETSMNELSSRSHAILRFIIESYDDKPQKDSTASYIAYLNIVDLAGSENAEQSGNEEIRIREGSNVNRSLFTLSRVISQLTSKSSYVSFRDSKLTRLLKTSLGGNSKTLIICTASPVALTETSQALKFASRAKRVKNKPMKNKMTDDALLSKYLRTIEELRRQLEENQRVEHHERDLEAQNEQLNAEVRQLRGCILSGQHQQQQRVLSVVDENKWRRARRQTWGGGARAAYRMRLSPTFGRLNNYHKNIIGSPIQEETTSCTSARSSIDNAENECVNKMNVSTCNELVENASRSNLTQHNTSQVGDVSRKSDDSMQRTYESSALPDNAKKALENYKMTNKFPLSSLVAVSDEPLATVDHLDTALSLSSDGLVTATLLHSPNTNRSAVDCSTNTQEFFANGINSSTDKINRADAVLANSETDNSLSNNSSEDDRKSDKPACWDTANDQTKNTNLSDGLQQSRTVQCAGEEKNEDITLRITESCSKENITECADDDDEEALTAISKQTDGETKMNIRYSDDISLHETSVIAFSTCQQISVDELRDELNRERSEREKERNEWRGKVAELESRLQSMRRVEFEDGDKSSNCPENDENSHLRDILMEGKRKYDELKKKKTELEKCNEWLKNEIELLEKRCDEADENEQQLRHEIALVDSERQKLLEELHKELGRRKKESEASGNVLEREVELECLRNEKKQFEQFMKKFQRELSNRDKKISALQCELRRVTNTNNAEDISLSMTEKDGQGLLPTLSENTVAAVGIHTPTAVCNAPNPSSIPPSAPIKQAALASASVFSNSFKINGNDSVSDVPDVPTECNQQ